MSDSAAPSTDDSPRTSSTVNSWLVAALLVLVAVVMLKNAGIFPGSLRNPLAAPRPIEPRGELASDEKSTIEIFKQASPSVVHIMGLAVRRDRLSRNPVQIPEGTGTGFVWDDDGHIVTNFHVIRSANAAQVTLADNTTLPAKLVGYDADRDLAVLKIDAPPGKLQPIRVGESADLQVGQKVFAIGNPFGLDQSLTTGVISGVGRVIQSVSGQNIKGVIQTDAAINPGNSGGPLLDSAGRLIGVNTAIASNTGEYAGVGFAVPVDIVNDVVPQLVQHGKIVPAGLGILPLEEEIARRIGVDSGVVIEDVVELSGAAEAGLRPAYRDEDGSLQFDVITGVDSRPVAKFDDLKKMLAGRKVGEKVRVDLLRDGKPISVSITLQPLQRFAR